MQDASFETLLVAEERSVLRVTLNRPQKRNAMNSAMVAEIRQCFEYAEDNTSVRAIVLRGAQGHFCAGGDIADMRQSGSEEEQRDAAWAFNRTFGHLMSSVQHSSKIVIAALEGAVMGGGFGLACVSDMAIATSSTRFAMPETSLGLIPAQIAPFVVARIGLTQTRRLALLGSTLSGQEAHSLGLVHECVTDEAALDAALNEALIQVNLVAPKATAVTKRLVLDAHRLPVDDTLLDRAADDFADALLSAEGREGANAFVQKRAPHWRLDDTK